MTREQRTAVFHYWLSAVEVGSFLSHFTKHFVLMNRLFSLWLNMLFLVISSEPVGRLSSKPCPLSTAIFSFQRTEGAGGEALLSGCDTRRDSSTVKKHLYCYNVFFRIIKTQKFVVLQYLICGSHCRFRYESNHLQDISGEEDTELPPVKTLLQVLLTYVHPWPHTDTKAHVHFIIYSQSLE